MCLTGHREAGPNLEVSMRARGTASVLGVAVLAAGVLVACGGDNDSDAGATTDTTATATATTATAPGGGPLAGVPAPSGGSSTGTQSILEGGVLASYDTLASPAEVVDRYETELADSGWDIVGGDAGGQGAGGTGLQAAKGNRYLSIDAGETAVGSTFVSVCGWPQEPTNPECTFIEQGSSTTGG